MASHYVTEVGEVYIHERGIYIGLWISYSLFSAFQNWENRC